MMKTAIMRDGNHDGRSGYLPPATMETPLSPCQETSLPTCCEEGSSPGGNCGSGGIQAPAQFVFEASETAADASFRASAAAGAVSSSASAASVPARGSAGGPPTLLGASATASSGACRGASAAASSDGRRQAGLNCDAASASAGAASTAPARESADGSSGLLGSSAAASSDGRRGASAAASSDGCRASAAASSDGRCGASAAASSDGRRGASAAVSSDGRRGASAAASRDGRCRAGLNCDAALASASAASTPPARGSADGSPGLLGASAAAASSDGRGAARTVYAPPSGVAASTAARSNAPGEAPTICFVDTEVLEGISVSCFQEEEEPGGLNVTTSAPGGMCCPSPLRRPLAACLQPGGKLSTGASFVPVTVTLELMPACISVIALLPAVELEKELQTAFIAAGMYMNPYMLRCLRRHIIRSLLAGLRYFTPPVLPPALLRAPLFCLAPPSPPAGGLPATTAGISSAAAGVGAASPSAVLKAASVLKKRKPAREPPFEAAPDEVIHYVFQSWKNFYFLPLDAAAAATVGLIPSCAADAAAAAALAARRCVAAGRRVGGGSRDSAAAGASRRGRRRDDSKTPKDKTSTNKATKDKTTREAARAFAGACRHRRDDRTTRDSEAFDRCLSRAERTESWGQSEGLDFDATPEEDAAAFDRSLSPAERTESCGRSRGLKDFDGQEEVPLGVRTLVSTNDAWPADKRFTTREAAHEPGGTSKQELARLLQRPLPPSMCSREAALRALAYWSCLAELQQAGRQHQSSCNSFCNGSTVKNVQEGPRGVERDDEGYGTDGAASSFCTCDTSGIRLLVQLKQSFDSVMKTVLQRQQDSLNQLRERQSNQMEEASKRENPLPAAHNVAKATDDCATASEEVLAPTSATAGAVAKPTDCASENFLSSPSASAFPVLPRGGLARPSPARKAAVTRDPTVASPAPTVQAALSAAVHTRCAQLSTTKCSDADKLQEPETVKQVVEYYFAGTSEKRDGDTNAAAGTDPVHLTKVEAAADSSTPLVTMGGDAASPAAAAKVADGSDDTSAGPVPQNRGDVATSSAGTLPQNRGDVATTSADPVPQNRGNEATSSAGPVPQNRGDLTTSSAGPVPENRGALATTSARPVLQNCGEDLATSAGTDVGQSCQTCVVVALADKPSIKSASLDSAQRSSLRREQGNSRERQTVEALVLQHVSEFQLVELHWKAELLLRRRQQLRDLKNVAVDLVLLRRAMREGHLARPLVLPPLPSAFEGEVAPLAPPSAKRVSFEKGEKASAGHVSRGKVPPSTSEELVSKKGMSGVLALRSIVGTSQHTSFSADHADRTERKEILQGRHLDAQDHSKRREPIQDGPAVGHGDTEAEELERLLDLYLPASRRRRQAHGSCSGPKEEKGELQHGGKGLQAKADPGKSLRASDGPGTHLRASDDTGTRLRAPDGPGKHLRASDGPGTHLRASGGPGTRLRASDDPVTGLEASCANTSDLPFKGELSQLAVGPAPSSREAVAGSPTVTHSQLTTPVRGLLPAAASQPVITPARSLLPLKPHPYKTAGVAAGVAAVQHADKASPPHAPALEDSCSKGKRTVERTRLRSSGVTPAPRSAISSFFQLRGTASLEQAEYSKDSERLQSGQEVMNIADAAQPEYWEKVIRSWTEEASLKRLQQHAFFPLIFGQQRKRCVVVRVCSGNVTDVVVPDAQRSKAFEEANAPTSTVPSYADSKRCSRVATGGLGGLRLPGNAATAACCRGGGYDYCSGGLLPFYPETSDRLLAEILSSIQSERCCLCEPPPDELSTNGVDPVEPPSIHSVEGRMPSGSTSSGRLPQVHDATKPGTFSLAAAARGSWTTRGGFTGDTRRTQAGTSPAMGRAFAGREFPKQHHSTSSEMSYHADTSPFALLAPCDAVGSETVALAMVLPVDSSLELATPSQIRWKSYLAETTDFVFPSLEEQQQMLRRLLFQRQYYRRVLCSQGGEDPPEREYHHEWPTESWEIPPRCNCAAAACRDCPHPLSLCCDVPSQAMPRLRTGDVFISRHSNSGQVRAVFHLVVREERKTGGTAPGEHSTRCAAPGDSHWAREAVPSRVLEGVGEVLRLSSTEGVRTLLLPVLLLEGEAALCSFTYAGLQRRALQVLRCVVNKIKCIHQSGAGTSHLSQIVLVLPPTPTSASSARMVPPLPVSGGNPGANGDEEPPQGSMFRDGVRHTPDSRRDARVCGVRSCEGGAPQSDGDAGSARAAPLPGKDSFPKCCTDVVLKTVMEYLLNCGHCWIGQRKCQSSWGPAPA